MSSEFKHINKAKHDADENYNYIEQTVISESGEEIIKKNSIKTTHVIPSPVVLANKHLNHAIGETSNSNESLPDCVATHRLTSPALLNDYHIIIRTN